MKRPILIKEHNIVMFPRNNGNNLDVLYLNSSDPSMVIDTQNKTVSVIKDDMDVNAISSTFDLAGYEIKNKAVNESEGKMSRIFGYIMEKFPDDAMSILGIAEDSMDVRYFNVTDIFETYPDEAELINNIGVSVKFESNDELASFNDDIYDNSEEYNYDCINIAYFEDDKANMESGDMVYIIYSDKEEELAGVVSMMNTMGYNYEKEPLKNYM